MKTTNIWKFLFKKSLASIRSIYCRDYTLAGVVACKVKAQEENVWENSLVFKIFMLLTIGHQYSSSWLSIEVEDDGIRSLRNWCIRDWYLILLNSCWEVRSVSSDGWPGRFLLGSCGCSEDILFQVVTAAFDVAVSPFFFFVSLQVPRIAWFRRSLLLLWWWLSREVCPLLCLPSCWSRCYTSCWLLGHACSVSSDLLLSICLLWVGSRRLVSGGDRHSSWQRGGSILVGSWWCRLRCWLSWLLARHWRWFFDPPSWSSGCSGDNVDGVFPAFWGGDSMESMFLMCIGALESRQLCRPSFLCQFWCHVLGRLFNADDRRRFLHISDDVGSRYEDRHWQKDGSRGSKSGPPFLKLFHRVVSLAGCESFPWMVVGRRLEFSWRWCSVPASCTRDGKQ